MTAAPMAACWRVIGVFGDRSCPELVTHIHCRNCPVFAAAGRELLQRPAPPGYRAQWAELLAAPRPRSAQRDRSVVIFRVGTEWLALDTRLCVEVAEARPVHAIAHRSRELLSGLVNVRGQLLLCVSLRGLLQLPGGADDGDRRLVPRLLVIDRDGETWALAVDGVHGAHRCAADTIQDVPATVTLGLQPFATGVMPWPAGAASTGGADGRGETIGVLDGDRLFEALRRRIG